MANNSNIIIKTNIHLSPHTSEHKIPRRTSLDIKALAKDRHKDVEGLNLLVGFHQETGNTNGIIPNITRLL